MVKHCLTFYFVSNLSFNKLPADVKLKIQEFIARGLLTDEKDLLGFWAPKSELMIVEGEDGQEELKRRETHEYPATMFLDQFRSSNEVKQHMGLLSEEQQNVFRYYEQFQLGGPISRLEVETYLAQIKEVLENNLILELCGAYRRGDAGVNEIDILITSREEGDLNLLKIIETLEANGMIAQQLKEIRMCSNGTQGFQGIASLKEGDVTKFRRIDIHMCNEFQRPFQLIYFTGPAGFNKWIRQTANKKGYSLSDSDIVAIPETVTQEALEKLTQLKPITLEEDVFKALDLNYVTPEERRTVVQGLSQDQSEF